MATTKLNNGQLPTTLSSKTIDNSNDINTTTTRLKISGGSNGQVLSTDGSSNLSWTTAAGVQIQVDTFTSSGTWTKPSWAKKVELYLLSGGGGGNSGARRATTLARIGGSGGTAGTITYANLIATDLGATESVTIGAGGTGGASQTTDSSAGNFGTIGGRTLFGSVFQAPSAANAATHQTSGDPNTLGSSAVNIIGLQGIQPPQSGAGNATSAQSSDFQKSGGGGGFQNANTTTTIAGGAASSSYSNGTRGYFQTATTGAAGGTNGGNGADGSGSVTAFGLTLGNGGGGGSYKTAQATGNGGNASNYGAGGGGGAASDNGFNSGAGGNGSGGMAVVISMG